MTDKPKEPKDKVLELINWIDENKSEIIKWHDGFGGASWLVIGFFVAVALIAGFSIRDYAVSIVIIIGGLTGLIAYFSLIVQTSEGTISERRFERAMRVKNNFNDRDRVLLKALIKIKGNNEEINLKTLYAMDKEANGEIFNEKKLLEILCK